MTKMQYLMILALGLLTAGCTTLHTAASKGNVKAIDRLIHEEANIDETDGEGNTPLIYAVMLNQKESLMALLKAGADVNTQSNDGNTALHVAVLQGNSKFVSILMEHNADTRLQNKEGKTALDIAKAKSNSQFVALLSKNSLNTVAESLIKEEKHVPSVVPSVPSVHIDTIEPIAVITQPVIPIASVPVTTISSSEAVVALKKMIAGRETMGIRNFLNVHPESIDLIEDPMQRIRYIGPNGWRVIDIIENMGRGRIKEEEVVHHIISSNLPYKVYNAEEMKMLSRYGMSNQIIDAMVKVTK